MTEAYLGLGTNIGNRLENLQRAVNALRHLPSTTVERISSVYETEPWGFKEQQNFYNICVCVNTELSAHVLLGGCLGIEADMGRERPFKNSPRIIDIDVLLYEGYKNNTGELTVPHKEMYNRAFVLYPLSEIIRENNTEIFTALQTDLIKNQAVLKTKNTIY